MRRVFLPLYFLCLAAAHRGSVFQSIDLGPAEFGASHAGSTQKHNVEASQDALAVLLELMRDNATGLRPSAAAAAAASAGSDLGLFAQGLHAASGGHVDVVVTGNEASDADSIVGALLYAYLKQRSLGAVVVPIVACDREDMPLRQETILLLGLCGVNWQHLVFGDDAVVERLLEKTGGIFLVDHNKATGAVAKHGAKVVDIVDHHQDAGAHTHVRGANRDIAFEGSAATAGSCCSMIAERFAAAEGGVGLLAQGGGAAARALLGVIAIDTIDLKPAAGKVTPRDVAAAELCATHAPSPTRKELFDAASAAKFDPAFWESLTPAQCFRYDYKSFTEAGRTYGLSSCLLTLESLCAKPGFLQEMQEKARGIELFGVLTSTMTASGFTRQLLLFSHEPGVLNRSVAFLEDYSSPTLELAELALPGIGDARAFRQGNVGASRKQIAPALGAFMATL